MQLGKGVGRFVCHLSSERDRLKCNILQVSLAPVQVLSAGAEEERAETARLV